MTVALFYDSLITHLKKKPGHTLIGYKEISTFLTRRCEQRLLASPCSSVLSVRMYQQRGPPPHWTDFREIWCWRLLWKICVQNPNLFTTRTKISLTLQSDLSRFRYWRRPKFVMTALLCITRYSHIVDSDMHINNNTEDVFFHCNNDYVNAPLCRVLLRYLIIIFKAANQLASQEGPCTME